MAGRNITSNAEKINIDSRVAARYDAVGVVIKQIEKNDYAVLFDDGAVVVANPESDLNMQKGDIVGLKAAKGNWVMQEIK